MDEGGTDHDDVPCHLMEIDLLKHKIRRLVAKLQKHDVHLEVFDPDHIVYGDVIGKGGEGIVRKCTINYQGIVNLEAAVKTLSDNSSDAISLTLDEIELLCLAQDHIFATTVKVYGMSAVPDVENPELGQLVIITEAGIMNALQLYQEMNVPLGVTLDLWSRLAAAMHLIHNKKIIHQDLKPENILITDIKEDVNRQVERIDFRIIDMGMAKRVYTEKVITDDILGTNGYHPPEVLNEEGYDFRADIFSLGITYAVMLHNPTFLRSKDLSNLLKQLHEAKVKNDLAGKKLYEEIIEPSIEQEVPSRIKTMLCNMMQVQEKRTLALSEIIQICSKESDLLIQKQADEPPVLQHSRCFNCNDSGFSATSSSSRQHRSTKAPLGVLNTAISEHTPRPRRRSRLRHKRRRDDVSPTVSMSSIRTTASTASSIENARETRAMKRLRSESCVFGEWNGNVSIKRTRRGTIRE